MMLQAKPGRGTGAARWTGFRQQCWTSCEALLPTLSCFWAFSLRYILSPTGLLRTSNFIQMLSPISCCFWAFSLRCMPYPTGLLGSSMFFFCSGLYAVGGWKPGAGSAITTEHVSGRCISFKAAEAASDQDPPMRTRLDCVQAAICWVGHLRSTVHEPIRTQELCCQYAPASGPSAPGIDVCQRATGLLRTSELHDLLSNFDDQLCLDL